MKLKIFSIILFFFLTFLLAHASAQTSCINCHKQLEDELKTPTDALQTDIHLKNGISCDQCHGGNPDIKFEDDAENAMNNKMGYIGIPAKRSIPKLCSKCHSDAQYMRSCNPNLPTDQYQRYLTSQHGKQLKKVDEKVAVCTDCHGKHNILPANMTKSKIFPNNIPETCGRCHSDKDYMKSYGIATDQLELYKQSIHGITLFEKGDRSSPVCNDCHGNHGAYPPGIASISHVCGTCHISQLEMFSQSPHNEAFAEMELPQCESCHGNHKILDTTPDMLGVGESAFCIECHDKDSKGYQIARIIKQQEDSLINAIKLADSLLNNAEKAGVEVSEGKYILKETDDILIKAQNSVHTFSLNKFKAVISPGFENADKAVIFGRAALKEVQTRRRALAIVSLIIFIVAISLFIKIKSMEKS